MEVSIKKNCKKKNQEKFRIEKILKRKGDKLCVKWKRYDDSFNSWIDKKRPYIKLSQYFLSRLEVLQKILTSRLIFVIMQQKLIEKM